MDYISHIPLDIFHQIIRPEFDIQIIVKLCSVSQYFNITIKKTRYNHLIRITNSIYIYDIVRNYNFAKYDISRLDISDYHMSLLKNATEINLSNCKKVTSSGFYYLSNCISVNLENCIQIVDEDIKYIAQCISVNLNYCRQLTIYGLKHLSGCHTIKLVKCPNVSDKCLYHFSACQEIWLSECKNITDNSLKFLAHCKVLHLEQCTITDTGLSYLSNCCEIYLDYCKKISDNGMVYLTNCYTVSIRGCKLITDNGLACLSKCYCISLGPSHNNLTLRGVAYLTNCVEISLYRFNMGLSDYQLFNKYRKIMLYKCDVPSDFLKCLANCTEIEIHTHAQNHFKARDMLYLKNIKKVVIDSYVTNDDSLKYLKSCHNVAIMNSPHITNNGLKNLANCDIVKIVQCKKINVSGILTLSKCSKVIYAGNIRSDERDYIKSMANNVHLLC